MDLLDKQKLDKQVNEVNKKVSKVWLFRSSEYIEHILRAGDTVLKPLQ